MRHLLKLSFIAIAIISSGCSQKMYYQLYEVKAENTSKGENQNNTHSFQKDSLTVTYNFWGKNGNLSFVVENESSDYVYLNLKESYFTVNGWTHNYYDQATYSISKSTSKEVNEAASFPDIINPNQRNTFVFGEESSNEVKTSFEEKEKIGIPPKSKKQFMKFNLKNDMHTNCDLNLYPKESDTLTFRKNLTPLTFQNILHYSFKGQQKPSGFIENKFWIKEIINMNGDEFSYIDSREVCENKLTSENIRIYPHTAPNRFYLEYQGNYSGGVLSIIGILGGFGLLLALGLNI